MIEDFSKSEKMHQVAASIFSILINFNLEDLNFARVARLSKVSRPWLYKYIGKNKSDLMKFAIEYLGKYVTNQDISEKVETRSQFVESVLQGMERMFAISEKYPFFIPVYFKYKGTNTPPGNAIHDVEQAYIKRQSLLLQKIYPSFDTRKAEFSAEMMTSFRMVLAFNWQRGELSKKASKAEVLGAMGVYLKELLGPV